jgi:hypothetical protein
MHDRGADKRLSEKRGDLQLLCLLLHALIHRFLYDDDSLPVMLKFQAPMQEIVNPKQMID